MRRGQLSTTLKHWRKDNGICVQGGADMQDRKIFRTWKSFQFGTFTPCIWSCIFQFTV